MSAQNSATTDVTKVELKPSYKLPAFMSLVAGALSLVQPWWGLVIAILSVFLFFQAATIRLKFTENALEVCRQERVLRNFPYVDWQNWRIFWKAVPILFYFKEVKSIHFLPILFDPKMLEASLEKYCPLE